MNDLLVLALHNSVAALALAILVYAVTRIWRSPPIAHVLWLLVLIKLVTPPLIHVDWSQWSLGAPSDAGAEATAESEGHAPPRSTATTPAGSIRPRSDGNQTAGHSAARPAALFDRLAWLWSYSRPYLLWIWLSGSLFYSLRAGTQAVRFHRMLKETLPAPRQLQELTRELTGKLGIARSPDVRIVACVDVPMVWCVGRKATIVLPLSLMDEGREDRIAMILAHELAHLRRRDHWVRGIEMIVSILYWWNPLVWAVRRQLHQAEDECCDAWVGWVLPNRNKDYAETLLEVAEQVSASRVGQPALASPFLRRCSLKARIEMILEGRVTHRASRTSKLALAILAVAVLPLFVQPHWLAELAAAADKQSKQEQTRGAAKSADGYKQLQRIGLALHGYHDIYGHFPPATLVGPDGTTRYSWRVELVPMLKYYAYSAGQKPGVDFNAIKNDRKAYWKVISDLGYDLNAPWDSPANKKFASEYAEKYWNVDGDPKSVNSRYFAVTGPGTVFADYKGTPLTAITDKPSATLFVVEAKRDVPWTKPVDIAYSPKKDVPAFGGFAEEGYLALTCDGAVHSIPKDTDAQAIRALITPDKGDSFSIEGIPYQSNR